MPCRFGNEPIAKFVLLRSDLRNILAWCILRQCKETGGRAPALPSTRRSRHADTDRSGPGADGSRADAPAGLALAGLLLAGVAGPALAGKANDTLVYASDSEPENLSPYHNNLREGVILARNVWDTLIDRDPKTGAHRPMLATAWTWVDPVTLDLTIREGVTFHNGDPLTPEDVAFTFTTC